MTQSNPGNSPTPFPLSVPWPSAPQQLSKSGGGDGGGSHPWPWPFTGERLQRGAGDDTHPWPWPTASFGGGGNGGGDVPWPWSAIAHGLSNDLIGRKLRVSTGPVTMEIDPGRVTILIDNDNRILDFWIDRDLSSS